MGGGVGVKMSRAWFHAFLQNELKVSNDILGTRAIVWASVISELYS